MVNIQEYKEVRQMGKYSYVAIATTEEEVQANLCLLL